MGADFNNGLTGGDASMMMDTGPGDMGPGNGGGDMATTDTGPAPDMGDLCAAVSCPGEAPLCQPSTGRCVACLEGGDCTLPEEPRCDTTRGECVTCLGDGDCGGATSACDVAEGECVECVECLANTDCGPEEWCSPDYRCED